MKLKIFQHEKISFLFGATLFFAAQTFAQSNVGIDETNPASKLSTKGNMSVGSGYSTTAAPANGAIIEGNVGIGTPSPSQLLHVYSSANDAFIRLETQSTTKEARMEFWKFNGGFGASVGYYPGTADLHLRTLNSSSAVVFDINSVEKMRVNTDGSVGIGTSAPNAKAILDVSSTTQGVFIPRMNTTQRDAIAGLGASHSGLLIYNTDTNRSQYWNGSSWTDIGSGVGGPPTGAAGGDLTGSYPNPTVANDAITSNKILDGTITNADIANGTIDLTAKVTNVLPVQNGGTGRNSLDLNTVIVGNNASPVKMIGVNSPGDLLMANGSSVPTFTPMTGDITISSGGATTISNDAVTSGKILDGTIVNADISGSAAIARSKIASGSANHVIVNDGSGNLSSSATVPVGNLPNLAGDVTGAINSNTIANNAVTTAKIADANVTTAKIADGNVTTAKLANDAVTSAKIADGSVADVDLTTTGVGAGTYTKVTVTDRGRVTSGTILSTGDIPDLSATYIRNQSSQQSGATFNVSGAGVVGTTMTAATYLFPAPAGDPSPVITTRTVPTGQGDANEKTELILFHSNDPANGAGNDQITLRAPALSFQTYNNAGVGDISNNAGYNERMYINPDGNVGIGVTNPLARLAITNTSGTQLTGSAASGTLTTYSGTLGSTAGNSLKLANFGFASANQSSLGIKALRTANGSAWDVQTAIGLEMDVDATDAAGGASIWLNSNGNVGIGTSGPAYKLDVAGNGRFGGGANTSVYLAGSATTGAGGIEIFGSGNVGYIRFHDPGVAWRDITLNNAGGNVGIGMLPGGYNLDVNGSMRVSANNATGGGIFLADDGSIVDQNDGYATHRFSKGTIITDGNNTNTNRINLTNMGNVIATAGLVTGAIQMKQGPGTGTDNTWHTVELDNGYAMVNLSIYATGSYMDGDIRMNGMYLRDLLNDGTRGWYHSAAVSTSINASAGISCDNCDHHASCPDNYIATGIQVYANSQLDYYGKLRCTALKSGFTTVQTGAGVESALSTPWNSSDNIQHQSSCPPGTFVKGFRLYAASYWDGAMRVYCTGIAGK